MEAHIKYRREENLYEIYDEQTKKSYWIKKDKKGKLTLLRVTDYN